MCRLLGLVATPNSADSGQKLPVWQQLVGAPHSLRVQAEKGNVWPGGTPGHDDSWGVAWFDAGGRASLIRQTGSAAQSAYFVFAAESAARGAAGGGPATLAVGHLRKASCGTVTSENAHPISAAYSGGAKSLLVAHNGTIREPLIASLRADLEDAGRPEAATDPETVSDTVILAGWLALRADGARDVFTAIAGALTEMFERAAVVAPGGDVTKAYSAVNLLIATDEGMFALRQCSHAPEYYTLSARPLTAADDGPAGWIVASEPTDDSPAWEPLPVGLLIFYPTTLAHSGIRTADVAGVGAG